MPKHLNALMALPLNNNKLGNKGVGGTPTKGGGTFQCLPTCLRFSRFCSTHHHKKNAHIPTTCLVTWHYHACLGLKTLTNSSPAQGEQRPVVGVNANGHMSNTTTHHLGNKPGPVCPTPPTAHQGSYAWSCTNNKNTEWHLYCQYHLTNE